VPQLVLEHLSFASPGRPSSFGFGYNCVAETYGIAIELKSLREGDKNGTGRGAIEEAAAQVIRGLNGLVNKLAMSQSMFGEQKLAVFLPVVFTTAKLWVCDARLEQADLLTGNIDISSSTLRPAPWVAFHYPVSPGLKHSVAPKNAEQLLWESYVSEHLRTICVVGDDAIEEFLRASANFNLSTYYLSAYYQAEGTN
jgi:hypothetical protein